MYPHAWSIVNGSLSDGAPIGLLELLLAMMDACSSVANDVLTYQHVFNLCGILFAGQFSFDLITLYTVCQIDSSCFVTVLSFFSSFTITTYSLFGE